ncbi:MAG: CotH kinase family protein [Melioribacteraceae bacterium]|nr:CotH kinase family protein [Melioribacteraceae bacterium]
MKLYATFFIALFLSTTFAQSTDQSWKLYDATEVASVRITMNSADYTWMMNNPHSDSLHRCSIHFKNKFIDTTIADVGIRIRGNTSRDSRKKSFKLSFNDFVPGREFYDVDKMNLNGEHNDPSIARAKISWDLFQNAGSIASRAAHAAVYINNAYHGLYISVEHIDDEFLKKNFNDDSGNLWKCLYPADLTYKGSDPNLYKLFSGDRQAYELTTNESKNDYTQLARFIKIINQTPQNVFADSLESIFHVEQFLMYQAMNLMIGGWDDYWSLMNNYYLYFEPTEKKFNWIPYDYDNTFGISWWDINWAAANPYNFPKVDNSSSRPLIERILTIPEYRNLYTHFIEFFRNNLVNINNLASKVNTIRDKITGYAVSDTYRTLDYGFTMSDFTNSFDEMNKLHVKRGIKEFIQVRYNSILNQINYVNAKPIIYKIDYSPKNPGPNDSIYVYASGFDNGAITNMTIQYHPGLLTVIYFYDMKFNPVQNGKVADNDRWVGVIPPLGQNGFGRFKIEATDNEGNKVIYPRNQFIEVKSGGSITNSVVINEFMADNSNILKDPAGEYDDWIELYNPTGQQILLSGMYLTDKKENLKKWQFKDSNLILNPGEHLIVWCDENHNDNQPGIHTNFKLSKDGEFIGIVSGDGTTWLDSLSFGSQTTDVSFGRFPDGSDVWRFMSPTPGSSNIITNIKEKALPTEFKVAAYPNPFNPSTTIMYQLPTVSDVSIAIYDLLGREIWTTQEPDKSPGTHKINWNGKNNLNTKVGSGLYICKVSSNKYSSIIKLLLMK